jgi:hypothetical protein
MHQVDRRVKSIHFAYDHENVYIRLDFRSVEEIELVEGLKIVIRLHLPGGPQREFEVVRGMLEETGRFRCGFDKIVELSVNRRYLWDQAFGQLGLSVLLVQDGRRLEEWPEHQPLEFDVPEDREEMFWPL